ncbi:MAG: HpaII family restriction endonuclease, partial [Phocaeicola sp.]
MAFEASKKEWSELYTFLKLLADGYVVGGTADRKADETKRYPIARVQREEHDGTRQYIIEKETVHISGEKIDMRIERELIEKTAEAILKAINESKEEEVASPNGVEEFLDELSIFDLEAKTEDRTDLHLAFYHVDAPLVGFCIRSKMARMTPLLDGGRTANFKFEQTGVKFSNPTVNNVNAHGEEYDVAGRMLLIESLSGVLKYNDVADKVFRSNLCMIDLHFPRMLAEMLRLMHLDDITKVSELTAAIKELNPLKIKDELINKHCYYEYKMKQFLLALALGMRSAKLFNGTDSAVAGFLMVDSKGEILCYSKLDRHVFEDFLFYNTRFEKSSTEKDKYGYLERENGVYYFKLNL